MKERAVPGFEYDPFNYFNLTRPSAKQDLQTNKTCNLIRLSISTFAKMSVKTIATSPQNKVSMLKAQYRKH